MPWAIILQDFAVFLTSVCNHILEILGNFKTIRGRAQHLSKSDESRDVLGVVYCLYSIVVMYSKIGRVRTPCPSADCQLYADAGIYHAAAAGLFWSPSVRNCMEPTTYPSCSSNVSVNIDRSRRTTSHPHHIH